MYCILTLSLLTVFHFAICTGQTNLMFYFILCIDYKLENNISLYKTESLKLKLKKTFLTSISKFKILYLLANGNFLQKNFLYKTLIKYLKLKSVKTK